ncbi:kinase-like domain-containing protein [Suillus bovinus]|uniref:kinase-like domain-containing protein n=1 Tax=Suillus bovinus TaxID=48563 RepID=UPI001B85BBC9|nr:kinase-like domain-containing protein [Suillus bovinus]KAG2154481.1 kinase-like domain-containing protein [Suillus bovinus]
MLFGEWQAMESTQSAPVITRPERDTFQLEIQGIVHAFIALPAQLRKACSEDVENLPVLGALYAYTFTHLHLCAPEKRSLIDELENLKAWLIREDDACLSNLKTMKDELVHILHRSQVEKHVCNTGLINDKTLHDLDINNIGALIVDHTTSNELARAFYADDNAQFMVEILQNLLTARSEILKKYRMYLVNAVFKLSRKSGRFPQSLQLRCIQDIKHTDFCGGFGLIYQGKLNGRLVAVKKVLEGRRSPEQFHKSFSNEAVIWYHMRHDNCLPFYGVYVFDDAWCLVSPWMTDGHVNHYLRGHPDADRYPLILDVARGLKYLHSMEPAVSHGDLKGVNILITSSGRACIADFGIVTARDSRIQMTTTTSGVIGTLHFMAPELLSADSAADLLKVDRRRCDMYALACVCYEMFTGMYPFQNQGNLNLKVLVLRGQRPERPREVHQVLDDFMWSLIEALWEQNPRDRLTAEQVCERVSQKMDAERKDTERPSTEVEWDVGFLADAAMTMVAEDPFALAHT